MLRSFFPEPRIFFPAAVLWTALCMTLWFTLGTWLEGILSVAPLLGVQPSDDPTQFFTPEKIWLYEYILLSGYLFCVPWFFYGRNRRWVWWSVVGSVTIVEVVYFNVQINAWLNAWYGGFYDLIQQALGTANSVTLDEYFGKIATVAIVLSVSITILVLNAYLQQHYLFRWRRAMSFYYLSNWQHLRTIEGAAQRVQEDTRDFANSVEGLGLSFIDSVMTLIVFLPLLMGLSENITELPFGIGPVSGSLVWVALVSAAFGTALLWLVGLRLPGLEFKNQRVEAAFRKELVFGEDDASKAQPIPVREFFRNVQRNYFRLYFNYLYFNVARYAYLQFSVFFPYIAMGPSIVAAAITLGLFQQILQAFSQVSDSFRFLVSSWTTIIRLISIFNRLRGFERNIPADAAFANDFDDPVFLASGLPGAAEPAPVPQE